MQFAGLRTWHHARLMKLRIAQKRSLLMRLKDASIEERRFLMRSYELLHATRVAGLFLKKQIFGFV